ncbi:MAG: hypothetical protein MI748_20190, partial [Opitutales bacterium]|nr:hypothetical protein [Opitutales bacterium]
DRSVIANRDKMGQDEVSPSSLSEDRTRNEESKSGTLAPPLRGGASSSVDDERVFTIRAATTSTDLEIRCDTTTAQHINTMTDFEKHIERVLEEFKDCFEVELPPRLPPPGRNQFGIRIDRDAPPPNLPVYRLSPLDWEEVNRQVKNMLEWGLINPSTSEYGAPVILVKKQDSGKRMCIDYRALNRITTTDNYPLPMAQYHGSRLGQSLGICACRQKILPHTPALWASPADSSCPDMAA